MVLNSRTCEGLDREMVNSWRSSGVLCFGSVISEVVVCCYVYVCSVAAKGFFTFLEFLGFRVMSWCRDERVFHLW